MLLFVAAAHGLCSLLSFVAAAAAHGFVRCSLLLFVAIAHGCCPLLLFVAVADG